MKVISSMVLFLFFSQHAYTQNEKAALTPKSIYAIQQVQSPRISPDGKWVLYTLSRQDSVKDASASKLYMVSRDGTETVSLTEQTKSPGSPQWSPDNKYISFLSRSSSDDKEQPGRQLYLMDRRGGEPFQLTNIKGEIQSYAWSNDARKIVFVIKDPSTADTAKTKIRKPYDITRYQFKQDYQGYLDTRKSHLYLFDVDSKKLDTLTRGSFNETEASFSADGKWVTYVSNTSAEPDRNSNTDIYVIDIATRNAKAVTVFKGSNGSPRFSPDGQFIAYSQSISEDSFNMYDITQLCVTDFIAGSTRILSGKIDRSFSSIHWSPDSKKLYSLYEDDRSQQIISFDMSNGEMTKITAAEGVYSNIHMNSGGDMVCLFSHPYSPNEIFMIENGTPRKITRIQDDFLSRTKLAHVRGFQSKSADGTTVSNILYLPDSSAKNLPLILFIHGGPVAQDEFNFDISRQILASAGFAVAAVNYRGSSGRGYAYAKAIYADWGNKEVVDIIGAANHLIKAGIADASRMGIGGWSYGGILTNYTIATDTRFKAAVSGAGSSFQFTMYGTDQYVKQYDDELGPPWRNFQKWVQLSYPFLNVQKIKTPTLFMASEDDFNVPVAGAEQMYQAFKYEGIPTELTIFPGQNHGLSVPSYIVHRYVRHIAWFSQYLK